MVILKRICWFCAFWVRYLWKSWRRWFLDSDSGNPRLAFCLAQLVSIALWNKTEQICTKTGDQRRVRKTQLSFRELYLPEIFILLYRVWPLVLHSMRPTKIFSVRRSMLQTYMQSLELCTILGKEERIKHVKNFPIPPWWLCFDYHQQGEIFISRFYCHQACPHLQMCCGVQSPFLCSEIWLVHARKGNVMILVGSGWSEPFNLYGQVNLNQAAGQSVLDHRCLSAY